ncbi:MAG TPA: hypothetical protein VI431_04160 [Candidatus Acidoferrum sp.]
MRILNIAAFFVGAVLGQHWTLTADETIWRSRYTNGTRCYVVDLPPGVIAHSSLPPSPNHGFLISGLAPESTTEVSLDADRLVGVYDTYDAAEYGSAGAYLKQLLEWEGGVDVLTSHSVKFQGLKAAYVHFRKKKELTVLENEELVVYRRSKFDSPMLYVIWIRSTSQGYAQDKKLYEQVRNGFHILPSLKGGCSQASPHIR